MAGKRIHLLLAAAFLLVNLPVIFHFNDFVHLQGNEFTDIEVSHYPNLIHIQQSIVQEKEIPLWSNLIQSGYPFVENPLSGIWYLWGWIALIFPLPAGINLNIFLHLAWGILGMFFLLKIEGRSDFAAAYGALAFGLCAKMYAHYGAGHLTLIYALNWTPWLLFCSRRAVRKGTLLSFVAPGLCLGMILSADPRWILPAGLLWVAYVLLHRRNLRKSLVPGLLAVLTGLLTSIGGWYSMLQFLQHSTRAALTAAERDVYSLDLPQLFGFLFPDFGGNAEWAVYTTASILLLVILGLFLPRQNRPLQFWYAVAGLSLLLSFGTAIPGIAYLFSLPGFSLLRVPSRFLWLVIFSFSVIASFVFDYLAAARDRYKFDRLFFLVPISAFVLLITGGFFIGSGGVPREFVWSSIFFIASTVWIGLALHDRIKANAIRSGLFVLLALELSGLNLLNLAYVKPAEGLEKYPNVIARLVQLPKFSRVYTPSYSIAQDQAAYWQIQQINGVDPMQLKAYVEYFKAASGVDFSGYSVTLPYFKTATPAIDNAHACPNLEMLAELNVGLIVSDFSLADCPSLPADEIVDQKYVYALDSSIALAVFEDGQGSVEVLNFSPNRISVKTSGSGRLKFREIYYPGWQAVIDGTVAVVEKDDIFRIVTIPPGDHILEMRFLPQYLPYVLAMHVLSLLVASFVVFKEFRNAHG